MLLSKNLSGGNIANSNTRAAEASSERIPAAFRLAFPGFDERLEQDTEWCVVKIGDEWREIRFHDYAQVFEIPGLYEYLFASQLQCNSPQKVRTLLEQELKQASADPTDLRVLDLGAGNGLVGEQMAELGAQHISGLDIIPEAASAARRDRPGVYDQYFVLDMTKLSEAENESLAQLEFNCLTCIAALGFGDIPTEAFVRAYNLVAPGGWIAFNIKEDFLHDERSRFARLIRSMIEDDSMVVSAHQRYRHRLTTSGEPICYVAMIARKTCDFDRAR